MSEYSILSDDKKEINRKAALKYYYANKEECALKAKKWREKNVDYRREYQREAKRKRKQFAIEYLGNKCAHCGNQYHPAIYEFHHLDPATKDRDPSKMLSLKLERLTAELDKCILLCANCHRLEHHKESYGTISLS